MTTFIAVIFCAVAAGLALPCLSDLLALLARFRALPSGRAETTSETPRILFLVPAHDEELLIGRCLDSLANLDYPGDRLNVLVVADNCLDGTARAARRAGVACLERSDPVLRGKPRALAWAFRRIDLDAVDAIVVLDADSVVDERYARALATHAPLRDIVIQGYNDVSNPSDSHLTRMAAVFSAARALGMNQIKEGARLNSTVGNGFCIGAGVLKRYPWRAFSLTEDWELYAILTAEGVRIHNEPKARVFAQEARTLSQSGSQRRRWTAGKMSVLVTRAPEVLRSRSAGALQKLDTLSELLTPGPTVNLVVSSVIAATAYVASFPAATWIAGLAAVSVARLGAYTIHALTKVERPSRAAGSFLVLPFYALWRLGIQVSAMASLGGGRWVRTARHFEVHERN